ncbi:alpha-(1,3)-fucosyltransferase 7-like [Saccostrea cucullata]|uniref:alpha-(1,3)-fucosyltransferase 7-like n=1 Tax=Saccostrea cuccullata TaxID=36930 RepID=UPI002ED17630
MFQFHTVSLTNQRKYFSVIVCIGIIMIILQCFTIERVKINKKQYKQNEPAVHSVLYFNPPSHISPETWTFSSCRIPHCRATTDRSQMQSSKAVIFYQFLMPESPPPKTPGQKWIFASSESPVNTHNTSALQGWYKKFDWVMTYRLDGDFYHGYGELKRRTVPSGRNYSAIYLLKKFDVSWIVSHCKTQSRREEYVRELAKHIQVDTFGKCGDLFCGPKTGNENDTCHHLVSHNYKFYLSFENSLCRDYTSEKFYFIYLYDTPIIPVVRGAANGKSYLPQGTFIDTNDFESPKHLAKYLKHIGSNVSEYVRLLKRRDEFVSKSLNDICQSALCNLCERLHFDNLTSRPYDIKQWFFTDQCKSPTDLNFN